MYIECDPQTAEPEDYLQFTSQNSEEPQEMYEAMNPEDEPQDLYEEPGRWRMRKGGERRERREGEGRDQCILTHVLLLSPAVQGSLSPSLQGAARASQSSSQEDRQQEMYEEPVVFPQGHTPTPPASAENSGSGAVYMRAGVNVVPNTLSPETATEWMYDVSAPKADKMKVSQLQNVLCKGNLEKLGGKSKKTWQIRYCVLSGLFMYFYEKESSKTYRNRISLPQYTPELAPEHTNPKKRHYAFKLTHTDDSGKQKDYFFRSTKKESRDTWLKTIGEATQRTFPSMTSTSSKTSMTMPRMPSSKSSLSPETKARASSLGPEDVQQVWAAPATLPSPAAHSTMPLVHILFALSGKHSSVNRMCPLTCATHLTPLPWYSSAFLKLCMQHLSSQFHTRLPSFPLFPHPIVRRHMSLLSPLMR